NLKGIAALIEGRKAEEIIPLIKGTKCGFKSTSCPDQLALALQEALNEQQ
ncbi:MAG: TSCPD domain-containing protein, partial [Clostridia bacterium]|nr:TSCPD domain-containing protein [Clostridia bacterium]